MSDGELISYNKTFSVYNYKTKEYEYLATLPENWEDYIPQDASSQGIYSIHIKMGKSPTEAAKKVLEEWNKK